MRDDGRFHVMHKSVVDWLRKKEQAKDFFISDEDVYEANAALAKACIARIKDVLGDRARVEKVRCGDCGLV